MSQRPILLWGFVDDTERDAHGFILGARVGDLCYVAATREISEATVVLAASSTWVAAALPSTVPGDLTLDSDDPTLTIGNGNGGGSMLDLRKEDTRELRGPSYLNDGVRMFEWVWQIDEVLELRSLDAAGANPLDILSIQPNVGGASSIMFLGAGAGGLFMTATQFRSRADGTHSLGSVTERWGAMFGVGGIQVGSTGTTQAKAWRVETAELETTDATTTVIRTVATLTTNGQNVKIRVRVGGIGTGGSAVNADALDHVQEVMVIRESGSLTILTPTLVQTQTNGAANLWIGVSFNLSGNDVRLRVGGRAGHTIQWETMVETQVGGV